MTERELYDFHAHQIGGMAVSLMSRVVSTNPEEANRYGYKIQAFLDAADCALHAAEQREARYRDALHDLRNTFDENAETYERTGEEYAKAVARGYRCASTYVLSAITLVDNEAAAPATPEQP